MACDAARQAVYEKLKAAGLSDWISDAQVEAAVMECCKDLHSKPCNEAQAELVARIICEVYSEGSCSICCKAAGKVLGPVVDAVTWPLIKLVDGLLGWALSAFGIGVPDFSSIGNPMRDKAVAGLSAAANEAVKQWGAKLRTMRVMEGVEATDTIWIDGKAYWMEAGIADLLKRVLYASDFSAYSEIRSDKYGVVFLSSAADEDSMMEGASLEFTAPIHWGTWGKDNAMNWAAGALAELYARRTEAFRKALEQVAGLLGFWNTMDPRVAKVRLASSRQEREGLRDDFEGPNQAGGSFSDAAGGASGPGLGTVLVLGLLGAGGYFAWKRYGHRLR